MRGQGTLAHLNSHAGRGPHSPRHQPDPCSAAIVYRGHLLCAPNARGQLVCCKVWVDRRRLSTEHLRTKCPGGHLHDSSARGSAQPATITPRLATHQLTAGHRRIKSAQDTCEPTVRVAKETRQWVHASARLDMRFALAPLSSVAHWSSRSIVPTGLLSGDGLRPRLAPGPRPSPTDHDFGIWGRAAATDTNQNPSRE